MSTSTRFLHRGFALGKKILLYAYIFGLLYTVVEYYVMRWLDDPVAYLPLLIRVAIAGTGVGLGIALFEVLFNSFFRKKPFLFTVLIRAVVYSVIITLWLILINGVWESILMDATFREGLSHYLESGLYVINLITTMLLFSLALGMYQVNRLHRKGELRRFILGRYHRPREIERIFCFIDLNASTTLAEKMGNLKFGAFLKDYYSDLTEAILYSGAEVYQYVGDEIVLSWAAGKKPDIGKIIDSVFMMKQSIAQKSKRYTERYGHLPGFKAGLHGGPVVVTWVGEVRKEILYIGDVLNTTARIRSECQRLQSDFLVSGYIRDRAGETRHEFEFAEELVPRGKEQAIRVYRVMVDPAVAPGFLNG